MSGYLKFLILWSITGSPISAAVILIVGTFVLDHFTLGILPSPYRLVMRWLRQRRLETDLLNNPSDRRARRELGEIQVARGRYAEAVGTLRPVLEAGDDEPGTVFAMGLACLKGGHEAQGEKLLGHVEEVSPGFRLGEVHLELGRAALRRGDFASARTSLETFVSMRKGTIEGRVLLARAINGLGDDGAAALMRDAAWNEYVTAPGFQRRRERAWAWRVQPWRPVLYAALLLAALASVGVIISRTRLPNMPTDESELGP